MHQMQGSIQDWILNFFGVISMKILVKTIRLPIEGDYKEKSNGQKSVYWCTG